MAVETKKIKIENPEQLYKFLGDLNDRIDLAGEWIVYLEAKVKQLESKIATKRSPYKSAAVTAEALPAAPKAMADFYLGAGKNEHTKE